MCYICGGFFIQKLGFSFYLIFLGKADAVDSHKMLRLAPPVKRAEKCPMKTMVLCGVEQYSHPCLMPSSEVQASNGAITKQHSPLRNMTTMKTGRVRFVEWQVTAASTSAVKSIRPVISMFTKMLRVRKTLRARLKP